jgi:hypothetical protein
MDGRLIIRGQAWWFPYDRSLEGVMEKGIAAFHGAGLGSRAKAVLGLRKEWRRIASTSPLMNYVHALPRILKK